MAALFFVMFCALITGLVCLAFRQIGPTLGAMD